jgi:hypothetical protein
VIDQKVFMCNKNGPELWTDSPCQSETDVGGTDRWQIADAVRGTQNLCGSGPESAPHNTFHSCLYGKSPELGLFTLDGSILFVLILTPNRQLSMHVEEPKVIWLEASHRPSSLGGILVIPCVLA